MEYGARRTEHDGDREGDDEACETQRARGERTRGERKGQRVRLNGQARSQPTRKNSPKEELQLYPLPTHRLISI